MKEFLDKFQRFYQLKVAAITAAIGSYIAHIQKKGENK